MIIYNFRIHIFFRILLLVGSLIAAILSFQAEAYLISFLCGLSSLGLILAIFFYIDRVNQNFNDFLQAIKYNDFSFSSALENQGKEFEKLSE
ncbi:MAG: hypothetical protein AAF696_39375, partial [Bacteroidota bacterium]